MSWVCVGCHTCVHACFCWCVCVCVKFQRPVQTSTATWQEKQEWDLSPSDCTTLLWIHTRLKKLWSCSLLCNLTPRGQASPCRQKKTTILTTCAKLQWQSRVLLLNVKIIHHSWVRCVLTSWSVSEEINTLFWFDPARDFTSIKPYLFTVYLSRPGELSTCCVNVYQTTVPLRCFWC